MTSKKGKIIPNGVILKPHELRTVVFLTEQGYDVELIPKVDKEGVRTPDIKINNLKWEMKSPKGAGRYLIQNTIQKAIKQSHNIIIDLRRAKRPQEKCLRETKTELEKSKSLRRLKIITKKGVMLDFEK